MPASREIGGTKIILVQEGAGLARIQRFLSYHGGMSAPVIERSPLLAARKLGYHEARMEHLVSWSRKSISERLAAAASLTRRMCRMRGIAYDEQEADFTPSRVRRHRS